MPIYRSLNYCYFALFYPSYPKISLRVKFLFLRREETILAGIFVERDHLQTVDLASIVPSSSLNSGIQTRGILRRKAG